MKTCNGLTFVVLLGNALFLVGHVVRSACPDDGTPVLQMCTAESLKVFGAYLDSKGMADAYLECSCRVVSSSPVFVTVTPSSTLNPTTCKFTDVFFNAGLSNANYNWNCDNPKGFSTVNERVDNRGPLSFTIKRTDTSNSPDPGYCILLTAQTVVDVICGEQLQTTSTTTRRGISTIDAFPLKRRTTTAPPVTTTETTTTVTTTTTTDTTSPITSASTEQTVSSTTSLQRDTTPPDVTTSTSDSSSSSTTTAPAPFSSSASTTDATTPPASSDSSSGDTVSPVSVTARNTFRRNNATVAILPFPPFKGTTTTSTPTSSGSPGPDTSSTSTLTTTGDVTGLTPKPPQAAVSDTRELIGLVVGCILGTVLLIAIAGVCRYYHSSRRRSDPESDASTESTSDGSWDRTLFSRSTLVLKSNASTLMYKPSHEILFPPVNYLPTYKVY